MLVPFAGWSGERNQARSLGDRVVYRAEAHRGESDAQVGRSHCFGLWDCLALDRTAVVPLQGRSRPDPRESSLSRTSLVPELYPVPIAMVLLASLIAAVTDVWKFKVYNLLTFPLLASGLTYHTFYGGAAGLAGSASARPPGSPSRSCSTRWAAWGPATSSL